MNRVIVSILGTKKDDPDLSKGNHWSPSLSLVLHSRELPVNEFHIIYNDGFKTLAQSVQKRIEDASPATEVVLDHLSIKNPWDFEEVYKKLYDYSQSERLHRENTEYLVHINTGTNVARICLFLLVQSRLIPGKLIQTFPKEGHGETRSRSREGGYTIVDLSLDTYAQLSGRRKETLLRGLSLLKDGIGTRNIAYNQVIEEIERTATLSKSPILLLGATGSGKTKLAGKIYALKKSCGLATGKFISVNCATLDKTMAKSDLFGHMAHAFTDAATKHIGYLQEADNGVLFLDEIGELAPDVQTMLLKAIEEQKFRPLGGEDKDTITSHFQLICGSNQDLSKAVAEGKFREDLLARIQMWTYTLPGLKERPEDIEPNLDFELAGYIKNEHKSVVMNANARLKFLTLAQDPSMEWRGNFRDLHAIVFRLATLAQNGEISPEDVAREFSRTRKLYPHPHNVYPITPPHQPSVCTGEASAVIFKRLLGADYSSYYDRLDLAALCEIISVCKITENAAEAGRMLYNVSTSQKKSTNDSDRLCKLLKARFGLTFAKIKSIISTPLQHEMPS